MMRRLIGSAHGGAIIAVLLLGCGEPSSKPGPAGPRTSDFKSCTAAEQCVLVEACCGCPAGGRRVAIRQDAVAAYDADRKTRCAGNQCGSANPDVTAHPSCDAEAGCESNECVVLPHSGH